MSCHSTTRTLTHAWKIDDIPPCYDAAVAIAKFNALTPEEKAHLGLGIAQAASLPEAEQYFTQASANATRAIKNIDAVFITLNGKIKRLPDDGHKFLAEFQVIQSEFRTIVSESRSLAVRIAVHSESFDTIIIKFCADNSFTVHERISRIDKFIAEGEGFRADAEKMHKRFQDLKHKFETFTQRFTDWASDKEQENNERIKQLNIDIIQINRKVADLDSAIGALYAALAGIGAITAILVAACAAGTGAGVWWIVGVGLTLGGLTAGAIVGILVAKSKLLKERAEKEIEIYELQQEVKDIEAIRTELVTVDESDMKSFTNSVMVLQGSWVTVQDEAYAIKKWLAGGAVHAEMPTYMQAWRRQDVKVYQTMARYLSHYASGMTEVLKGF
ncbi:hypothetical protein GGX14DRAFT_637576 [Mycena pura]|uniref:Alpha-xenorhabdolysin family binary toxin subunit A n=1 Tax=Mycena pura TaxID=153505 RepID=A0AAD6VGN5_9AGAR|nr:hypothetical protein GGX14DRAFT_637576 [Mycena pura]